MRLEHHLVGGYVRISQAAATAVNRTQGVKKKMHLDL